MVKQEKYGTWEWGAPFHVPDSPMCFLDKSQLEFSLESIFWIPAQNHTLEYLIEIWGSIFLWTTQDKSWEPLLFPLLSKFFLSIKQSFSNSVLLIFWPRLFIVWRRYCTLKMYDSIPDFYQLDASRTIPQVGKPTMSPDITKASGWQVPQMEPDFFFKLRNYCKTKNITTQAKWCQPVCDFWL